MSTIKPYKAKSQNEDNPPKGSINNPYSLDEFNSMCDNGTWNGGYVEGMGYCLPTIEVTTSMPGSDSSDDSDPWGSDTSCPWSGTGHIPNPGGSSENGQNGNNNSENEENNPQNNIEGNSQSAPNVENASNDANVIDMDPSKIQIPDVLSPKDFRGFKQSESNGCFKRCNEMLAKANCTLKPFEVGGENDIAMTNYDTNGRPTTASENVSKGIKYISNQLLQGHPVIVAVDYHDGKTIGRDWNDKAGDHFVIIVGGSATTGYHYYDPATSDRGRGTSTENMFTLQNGMFKDSNRCTNKDVKYYTLTSIRRNQ